MVGRAKSATKKLQLRRQSLDWMERTVNKYRARKEFEALGGLKPGERTVGARRICQDVEAEFAARFAKQIKRKTIQPIHLPYNTMLRHYNGSAPKSKSNASRGWLTLEEIEIVIGYLLEFGRRGFPLTHQRLKEIVDAICRARLGDSFPAAGVGKNWTQRFVEKYSDRLKTFWATDREQKRGQAANPTTHKLWYDLLEDVLLGKRDFEFDLPVVRPARDPEDLEDDAGFSDVDEEEEGEKEDGRSRNHVLIFYDDEEPQAPPSPPTHTPIRPENIYGADESGFMAAGNTGQRVIGAAGKQMQHQTSDGGRENTTVLVTVQATGHAKRSIVIFKGSTFRMGDGQSIGMPKKGWTNSEIGLAYIKDFHEQTKDEAEGRTRVLLVDGHNSHYGLAFLRFVRAHRIHILCYPSHTTHIYQGLDVVIFGPLKHYWTEEKTKFIIHSGCALRKEHFLQMYAPAQRRACTVENIKMAFKKTSVWPFNRNAVTPDMLATSLETSSRGNLPVAPSTPVRALSTLIHDIHHDPRAAKRRRVDDSPVGGRAESDFSSSDGPDYFDKAFDALRNSSASFIISSSPITSAANPPGFVPRLISPQKSRKRHYDSLLGVPPSTVLEEQLQEALGNLMGRYNTMKSDLIAMQSSLVLNAAYCDRIRGQLAARESAQSKKRATRLVGDGLPHLLTAAEFVERVTAFEEAAKVKAAATAARKATAAEKKAMRDEWKELDDVRKAWNEEIRAEVQEEVAAWQAEKEQLNGKRPGWKKPITKGKLFPPLPKPWQIPTEKETASNTDGDSNSNGSDADD
uniref:HTH CENPB-type domain-containing protein n=1 Tax=Mycena chlorophos TaxID=658473 RepID=A0ABQ0LCQ4_MYCCL|nr:predicted protein [Mycena chlorophos]